MKEQGRERGREVRDEDERARERERQRSQKTHLTEDERAKERERARVKERKRSPPARENINREEQRQRLAANETSLVYLGPMSSVCQHCQV